MNLPDGSDDGRGDGEIVAVPVIVRDDALVIDGVVVPIFDVEPEPHPILGHVLDWTPADFALIAELLTVHNRGQVIGYRLQPDNCPLSPVPCSWDRCGICAR